MGRPEDFHVRRTREREARRGEARRDETRREGGKRWSPSPVEVVLRESGHDGWRQEEEEEEEEEEMGTVPTFALSHRFTTCYTHGEIIADARCERLSGRCSGA
ncbi:hypothetical protein PMIN06_007827 [Paraphaeosphaeria minitans]